MDRMACVDLPELPLQILLRRHPTWRDKPVAVVERDKPQGLLLWVNETARALRILPGMRYAVALSIASDLRAGVVPQGETQREVANLAERLRTFTPNVEAFDAAPGIFWLAAHGIMRLFPSYEAWAARISWTLHECGLQARIVVGFSRYGTYAAVRSGAANIMVFARPDDELGAVRRVRLDRLGVEPRTRDALARLGIDTLGAFMDLPPGGVQERFGNEALELHRKLHGDLGTPVRGEHPDEPRRGIWAFEHPETNVTRLVAVLDALLEPILKRMTRDDAVLAALSVRLKFQNGTHADDLLRPASPTLDKPQILRLVQLRLESRRLGAAVEELAIEVEASRARHEQLSLFAHEEPRDLRAANRALARLRAEHGEEAVTCARLRDAHLPEGRFTWEPLRLLEPARPRAVIVPPLVRRFHLRPLALPPRPRHEPDGWLIAGLPEGPVEEIVGPHVVAGGWWMRAVERAYFFMRTRSQRWLWAFEDRRRKVWFLHGEVE